MAIAYKSQGAGVATETSAAALSPECPATVDAGLAKGMRIAADTTAFAITGTDASTKRGALVEALTTSYVETGTAATLTVTAWDNRPIRTAVTAAAWA